MKKASKSFIQQANTIFFKAKAQGWTERETAASFDISKSEIHRLMEIARLPAEIKAKLEKNNVEKWAVIEALNPKHRKWKDMLITLLANGEIRKRKQVFEKLNYFNQ